MNGHHDVLISLITLGGVALTQATMFWVVFMQSRSARTADESARKVEEINDAVNHRHDRDGDGLKLYDLVCENRNETKMLVEWNVQQDLGCSETSQEIAKLRQAISGLPCKVVKDCDNA